VSPKNPIAIESMRRRKTANTAGWMTCIPDGAPGVSAPLGWSGLVSRVNDR
jgi:hypothetical protein